MSRLPGIAAQNLMARGVGFGDDTTEAELKTIGIWLNPNEGTGGCAASPLIHRLKT